MKPLLALLLLTLPCAAEVIVVPKRADLILYLQRGSATDAKAARVTTPRGLAFGEPICEPDDVVAPRCAFSHSFTDGDEESDLQDFRRRIGTAAVANKVLTGKETAQQRKAKLEAFGAILPALPTNWRYPAANQ
jgi:hypothetical protein